jgi:cobalt-zinc-cadmium efflux system membrane fusion protein
MTNEYSGEIPPDQRGGRLPRVLAMTGAIAAALITLGGCSPDSDNGSQGQGAPARNVMLTPAQIQHIRLYTLAPARFHKTVETTGVVDFDNEHATSVLAPFSGPVSRLLVSPGDQVKKGTALAVIDSADFAAAVGAYRKALAVAQTARKLADMDEDLAAHNGVSQREASQAESDAVSAESDREAALQGLVSLGVDPQTIAGVRRGRPTSRIDAVIHSPISGTLVEKLVTPGQLLQAGVTPCFTVADLSRVWVMAQVFDSDLSSVAVGDRAEVLTAASPNGFSGSVTNIAALVNPDTRSVQARVVVNNAGGLLKKQMYVRVRIESQRESTGILVPVTAILRDDDNLPFVYVAQRDGSFARQHVTLGYRTGEQNEVVAGLRAGDRIVVDGAIFIQFMQAQ